MNRAAQGSFAVSDFIGGQDHCAGICQNLDAVAQRPWRRPGARSLNVNRLPATGHRAGKTAFSTRTDRLQSAVCDLLWYRVEKRTSAPQTGHAAPTALFPATSSSAGRTLMAGARAAQTDGSDGYTVAWISARFSISNVVWHPVESYAVSPVNGPERLAGRGWHADPAP